MIFSGKKTKIHSNCLTSFYRFYHAFTEHVIFSHDRDHDMFIYCSTFSLMTLYCLVYSGLATPLHHLSWRCHCKCFPFHYFPRLEFPLFPDWKFPAAELLAAQSISQTDVPLERRRKKTISSSMWHWGPHKAVLDQSAVWGLWLIICPLFHSTDWTC